MHTISEATSIGIHALKFLAMEPEKNMQVKTLAEKMHVSQAHLAKIMQRLVRGGLATSVRGPLGGFMMAKKPSEVSLFDIIDVVEGGMEKRDCLFKKRICRTPCPIRDFLLESNERYKEFLNKTTVEQIS